MNHQERSYNISEWLSQQRPPRANAQRRGRNALASGETHLIASALWNDSEPDIEVMQSSSPQGEETIFQT
ncbi:hypothetical protein AU511_08545 [Lonsdalea iberica]|uniref:Uncharacterized protein n=1 Tax=Lonsdalea iberica TaxID=1082703 RepID=A0A1X3RVG6_9GAMM|nr:hypothetical protein AU511_08545 [Lonsdalea iberica]